MRAYRVCRSGGVRLDGMIAKCYQNEMAQALIRKIKDETLDDYRAEAKRNSRSLEAELRELIEQNRPKRRLTPEERFAFSQQLTTGHKLGTDSVLILREAREALSARSTS